MIEIKESKKDNKSFKTVLKKYDEFGKLILNSETENKELLNKFLKEKVKDEDKKVYKNKRKL